MTMHFQSLGRKNLGFPEGDFRNVYLNGMQEAYTQKVEPKGFIQTI